jgi:plasmid stabilization system protein ParE
MSFSVVWRRSAEQELAEIWLIASDRNRVTDAARDIDELLKTRPLESGESRGDEFRVLFVEPVGVFYRVDEADLRVTVLQVWRFER